MSLLDELIAGDQAALARALTLLERAGPDARALRAALRPHTGRASVIGVTGPPGAGKSSLIAAMVAELRAQGRRVAVLAVDPSSPVTGGAILGDRTRMGAHTADDGVFIRSIASRGQIGGLARAVPAFVDAIDAAGWPVVLLETVGSGQSDVEVAEVVDAAVVVSVPGLGDDLQAMKAGLLELADVLVVNKSDLPGAERTARQLETMLSLRATTLAVPPVVRVSAAPPAGIVALMDAVDDALRNADPLQRVRLDLLRAAEAEFSRRLRRLPLGAACASVRDGSTDIEEVIGALLVRTVSRSGAAETGV